MWWPNWSFRFWLWELRVDWLLLGCLVANMAILFVLRFVVLPIAVKNEETLSDIAIELRDQTDEIIENRNIVKGWILERRERDKQLDNKLQQR